MLKTGRTRYITDAEYVRVSKIDVCSLAAFSNDLTNAMSIHEMAWVTIRDGQRDMSDSFGMLADYISVKFDGFDASRLGSLPNGRYDLLRVYVMEAGVIVWSADLPTRRVYGKSDSVNPHVFNGTLKEHRRQVMMRDMNIPTRVTNVNPDKTFVISDMHFGDPKILKYCRKEFGSVGEMNETLLEKWNGTVGKSDRVFFLGDMTGALCRKPIDYWLSLLNGRMTFLRGNHDTAQVMRTAALRHPIIVDCHGMRILLSHYPYRPARWNGWIIHGHVHNSDLTMYPRLNRQRKTANVSAEMVNYAPVLLAELLDKMIG